MRWSRQNLSFSSIYTHLLRRRRHLYVKPSWSFAKHYQMTTLQKLVTAASQGLLGSPPSYQSTDLDLFKRLSIDPFHTGSILLVFKDHSPTPSLSFNFSSSNAPKMSAPLLETWMHQNAHPYAFELNSAIFPKVMRAPWEPLVVLVAATREESGEAEKVLSDANREYAKVAGETGRRVFFVWMDREKWGEWLGKMYGVGSNGFSVVITDHKV